MLNLAVIGTNWISEKFVQAATDSERFQLRAIYSRSIQNAKAFAPTEQQADCQYYDDLADLAHDSTIDAVYIASPNSLHCEQALQMMAQGKHVICEKPIASNLAEASAMYQCAEQNQVVLFEAFKTEFLPCFDELKNVLASVGKLHHASLSYCQYSSRYQKYLNGENPNTFNPQFSNGSIMDIGYYCIAVAVSLFGKPDSVQASAKLLDSGVDSHGNVLLSYPNFLVNITHSKVSDGQIQSEFQGEDGTILVGHISDFDSFTLFPRNGVEDKVTCVQQTNSMYYEAITFAEQIAHGHMNQAYVQRSLDVAATITEIRRQTQVVFPTD